MASLAATLTEVRACQLCAPAIEPRPVLQVAAGARILIAGQAPGARVHASGVAFADPSGKRLREWLGVTEAAFYDANAIAILPMGFCYPGTASSGDLPPRAECAPAWRAALLERMPNIELTVVLGTHALKWHLRISAPLSKIVSDWEARWPAHIVLPHPSPRNNPWLKRNPWFEGDVLPKLRERVQALLG